MGSIGLLAFSIAVEDFLPAIKKAKDLQQQVEQQLAFEEENDEEDAKPIKLFSQTSHHVNNILAAALIGLLVGFGVTCAGFHVQRSTSSTHEELFLAADS